MSENTNHSEDFLDAFYRKKAQEYEVHPVPNVFEAMMAKTVLAQDPIDSFYQKKASDYQITASPTAFDNIIRQTTIYQPSTFFTPAKVGGIILGIGLVAVGTWFLLNKSETTSVKKDSIVIEKKENVIIEPTQKTEEILQPIVEKEKKPVVLPIEKTKKTIVITNEPTIAGDKTPEEITTVVQKQEEQVQKINEILARKKNNKHPFDAYQEKNKDKLGDTTTQMFNEKKKD